MALLHGSQMVLSRLLVLVAIVVSAIGSLHFEIRRRTKRDRIEFIDGMAMQAQAAALSNDFRKSFQIVRLLAGFTPRPLQAVRLKNGSLSTTIAERDDRWQEHYCETFNGYVAECPDVLATRPTSLVAQHNFQHNPSDLERSIAELGNNKGLGPDEFAAEVAKAGGSAFAVKLYDVARRIVEEERWPVQWKGGRFGVRLEKQRLAIRLL